MGRGRVVAIDGPAGSGKSTLARALAAELHLPYVNTGLMYRALTARALRAGVDLEEGEALAEVARDIAFELDPRSSPVSLVIDGRAPGGELTTPEVEREVSRVSRHPAVRAVMHAAQRRLGEGGAVMEGRDIGTVVFPDAEVKFFLLAEPAERAARRILEREAEEVAAAPPEIAEALARRDSRDGRVNPLVPAPDAVAINTQDKDPGAVLAEALALVREMTGP